MEEEIVDAHMRLNQATGKISNFSSGFPEHCQMQFEFSEAWVATSKRPLFAGLMWLVAANSKGKERLVLARSMWNT